MRQHHSSTHVHRILRGIYFALLAGLNRRDHYRHLKNQHRLLVPLVLTVITVGVGTILTLVHFKSSQLLTESNSVFDQGQDFYPAAVPFKRNRQACEASNRKWIEDQCIDTVHNPGF